MVGSDLLLCDNKICRKMCVCAGGDEKNGCFGMKDRIFGLECVTTRTYQDNLSLAVSKKRERQNDQKKLHTWSEASREKDT